MDYPYFIPASVQILGIFILSALQDSMAIITFLNHAEKVFKLFILVRRKLSSREMKLPAGSELMAFDGKGNFIASVRKACLAAVRGLFHFITLRQVHGQLILFCKGIRKTDGVAAELAGKHIFLERRKEISGGQHAFANRRGEAGDFNLESRYEGIIDGFPPLGFLQRNDSALGKPSFEFIFQAFATTGIILIERIQSVLKGVFSLKLYGDFAG
ncbi:MAG TPA: hypothetical protein VGK36_10550 [Candidatus Angelobacter sp.]